MDVFHGVFVQIGDQTQLKTISPVAGGDINKAYKVQTGNGTYFIKANTNVPTEFFELEKEGLEIIRLTNTISVPFIYGVFEFNNTKMLVMEWVEGHKNQETERMLGNNLAHLHLTECQTSYGFNKDTFIGSLKQENKYCSSWLEYFRDNRLLSQVKIAIEKRRMPLARIVAFENLIERLDYFIPTTCKISILHGDLWGGNWIVGKNGEPYLIDPSVFYGHHEMDLAFTELFGGFNLEFYDCYTDVFPISPEYENRRELYQLYYLLVHLNLFGESYGASIDRILNRYTVK